MTILINNTIDGYIQLVQLCQIWIRSISNFNGRNAIKKHVHCLIAVFFLPLTVAQENSMWKTTRNMSGNCFSRRKTYSAYAEFFLRFSHRVYRTSSYSFNLINSNSLTSMLDSKPWIRQVLNERHDSIALLTWHHVSCLNTIGDCHESDWNVSQMWETYFSESKSIANV